MKNRFETLYADLDDYRLECDKKRKRHQPKKKHTKHHFAEAKIKKEKCAKMSTVPVEDDEFVLDILEFFYKERLNEHQLNSGLKELAANMLWAATDASKAMDMIPRPPKGVPSPTWLVTEAVQIGFRKANNNCIYEAIRKTTALKWRTAYDLAKMGINPGGMSNANAYQNGNYVHASAAVNYVVKDVPKIMQPSTHTCWSACTTILQSWYIGNPNLKIRPFLNSLSDKQFVKLYDKDVLSHGKGRGIFAKEGRGLFKLLGFKTIDQFNPTIETWEGYLRDYGPLYTSIAWKDGAQFHAIIVYGIVGDGTAKGTKVYIHDPAGSIKANVITFERLLELYENSMEWPMQIIHLPPTNEMVSTKSLAGQMSLSEIKSLVQSIQFSNIPLDPVTGGMSIPVSTLRPGDIILSTTNSKISKAIRKMTSSVVSHSILYIGDNMVIEAVGSGVVMRPIKEALKEASLAVAFEHPDITDAQVNRIINFAKSKVGKKYNKWGIVRQASFQLDKKAICERFSNAGIKSKCINWSGKFNLGTENNNEFFCSELILAAYKEAGLPLTTTPPHWNSPEDIAELRFSKRLKYVGHLIS